MTEEKEGFVAGQLHQPQLFLQLNSSPNITETNPNRQIHPYMGTYIFIDLIQKMRLYQMESD